MAGHGITVHTECSGTSLVYEMITLVPSPTGFRQVRVLRADCEHKIEDCLPLWAEARCVAVLQCCKVLAKLVLECLAGQDWEGVMHLAHVATQKSFGGLK